MVHEGHPAPDTLGEEHPHPTERNSHYPVSCPFCEAIVSLTDSECWRCAAYFAADAFDAQR
jgi:hypothetical protein